MTTRQPQKEASLELIHGHLHSYNFQFNITMAKQVKVSEYQTRVYTLLQQIPEGRITTYAALSKALQSSPRAVGGALRNSECPGRLFEEGISLILMVLKIHSRQKFRVIDASQVPACVLRSPKRLNSAS